jgi:hypothetical protein
VSEGGVGGREACVGGYGEESERVGYGGESERVGGREACA